MESSSSAPEVPTNTNVTAHRPSTPPPDSHISPPLSLTYWRSTPPTVSGMLGGFPQVSATDLRGSYAFIRKLFPEQSFPPLQPQPQTRQNGRELRGRRKPADATGNTGNVQLLKRAVDCGAGIGRVTRGLLARVAEKVDVVEPVEEFASVVRRHAHDEHNSSLPDGSGKVGEIFVCGLEDWGPSPSAPRAHGKGSESGGEGYDLIWNQWCLGHLRDLPLTQYLSRASLALAPGGFIVVKENISTDPMGRDMYDEVDSSVTRTEGKWEKVFGEAGLAVVRREVQGGFESGLGLMPVVMWALRPKGPIGNGG
ncbi:MAG: hypothetical protein Q9160_009054 [Pyrenula sp. 1 TL-2023]